MSAKIPQLPVTCDQILESLVRDVNQAVNWKVQSQPQYWISVPWNLESKERLITARELQRRTHVSQVAWINAHELEITF